MRQPGPTLPKARCRWCFMKWVSHLVCLVQYARGNWLQVAASWRPFEVGAHHVALRTPHGHDQCDVDVPLRSRLW